MTDDIVTELGKQLNDSSQFAVPTSVFHVDTPVPDEERPGGFKTQLSEKLAKRTLPKNPEERPPMPIPEGSPQLEPFLNDFVIVSNRPPPREAPPPAPGYRTSELLLVRFLEVI